MSSSVPQQGTETRTSILPTSNPSGLGFFGSPYSPADSLLSPPQIGVSAGSSMSNVMGAVKGVAFYTDMIGFGASSTGLTSGMPLKPLGINYFMKTGATCSNGANMYMYFQGIPQGNALGKRVADVMRSMKLPPLKGLAPGMVEDAENALNPVPLVNTLFGTGYPQCKQSTAMVGDSYGNISDPNYGTQWIDQPETAFKSGNVFYQTRWVQDTDNNGNPVYLSEEQWNNTPKTYNPDGTPIKTQKESFTSNNGFSFITVGILCAILLGFIIFKKRK